MKILIKSYTKTGEAKAAHFFMLNICKIIFNNRSYVRISFRLRFSWFN